MLRRTRHITSVATRSHSINTEHEHGRVRGRRRWAYTIFLSTLVITSIFVIFLLRNNALNDDSTKVASYSSGVINEAPEKVRMESGDTGLSSQIVGPSSESGTGVSRVATSIDSPLVECVLATSVTMDDASHSTVATDAANGLLQITLLPDISPLASAAFVDLVECGYYNGVYIFRVIKGFIVQWGFRPEWKWDDGSARNNKSCNLKKKWVDITDAVADGRSISNTRGTLTFAGKSTVQVFLNVGDNSRLDREGSRPFATLSDKSIVLAERIYTGYEGGHGQIPAIKDGKEMVSRKFPRMSRIENCRVVHSFSRPE